ncbi:hypothetical protein AU476_16390 [Cupriavidus sp. UYMSc13B]|nr:hypothetical protein AU476_16390 [Cupriavidus sp. UYMSc13B]
MVRAVDENQTAAAAGTTTSLSALSAEHGPFDLFKLDVEGAEKKILSEEIGFLQSSNSTFWVECNETVDSLDVAELFLNLGFSVHYFAFPAISSAPFRAGEANEAPFAYEAGLWATRGIAPRLNDALREAGCMLRPVTSRESLRTLLWRTPRWAPAAWLDGTREEVAALAVHLLFGEAYESYLVDASVPAHAIAPKWAAPIPTQLADRIQELEAQLAEERNHARAADVLLFEERRRSSLAIDRLQVELRNTFARTDALERHNADLLSSSSWRVTMPLRMLSRAIRGDWSEIKRITRAKLRRN